MVQYLPDLRAVGDERDDAHLPTAQRAQQGKHLVDSGNQHRPQVVRWRVSKGSNRMSPSIAPYRGYKKTQPTLVDSLIRQEYAPQLTLIPENVPLC